jgi:hypothetical protein
VKVLGLDLSSKPGYALLDEGKLTHLGTLFKLKDTVSNSVESEHLPDFHLMAVAECVGLAVRQLLLEWQPDLVFIEQSNQGSGMSSMKGQEFIHFAVLQQIKANGYGLRVNYVYSSSWRSACGLKMTKEQRAHNKLVKAGAARGKIRPKHLAVQWANQTFGLSLLMKDEDAADAIGIAYGGYEIWKRKLSAGKDKTPVEQAFT